MLLAVTCPDSRRSPEANSADSVHIEVALNGRIYSLSRDIDVSVSQPRMNLFSGSIDESMQSKGSWLAYPYRRSSSSESFSQVLFSLLGLPEQSTDSNQNVTMHQLLRLVYGDQLTSVERLFRDETPDFRDVRVAVGELLLGVDDLAMHEIRLRLRDLERRFNQLSGELRSLFQVLGQTEDSNIAVFDFSAEIQKVMEEQQAEQGLAVALAERKEKRGYGDNEEQVDKLLERLRKVSAKLAHARRQVQSLAVEIDDSEQFLDTLRQRIDALNSSMKMVSILGNIEFTVCPACFEPVETIGQPDVCHLCRAPVSKSYGANGYLKMREELAFQLRESEKLLRERRKQYAQAEGIVAEVSAERRAASSELEAFERAVDPIDAQLQSHLVRVGYLDRVIEDLHRKAELSAVVQEKISEKNRIGVESSELRDKLEAHQASRQQRTEKINSRISELTVEALHADLDREPAFVKAEAVEYDFAQNRMCVDGRTRFSASSTTYLKNAFLFSLFRLSLEDSSMRWPRFILLDNIEDKGMQRERSVNFQDYVARVLEATTVELQVIFTTSMISERLNESNYCVGPYYTSQLRTLQFVNARQ